MNRQELAERQKTISRNHWMFRLHKYTWNKEAQYEGFCPLFWMSVFNLTIIPITVAGKVFEGAVEIAVNLLPEKPKVYPKTKPIKPSDKEIVWLFEESKDRFWSWDDYGTPHFQKNLWLEQNPNWRDLYPAAKIRVEEENKKIEEREKLEEARRERLNKQLEKIAAWTQYLVKPALILSALAAGYAVYWIIGLLISNITLSFILGVLKILGGITLVTLTGWALFKLVQIGSRLVKFERKISEPEEPEEPSIFAKAAFAIGEGIEFLKNAVQIIYYRRCPLIKIADETKPIEKIKKD